MEEGIEMVKQEILDTACNLYGGGWRAGDKDWLIDEYKITEEYAEELCEVLRMIDEPVEEGYPLTFKEAVMAMLDGKVVVCEEMSGLYQRFQHGQFMVKEMGGDDDWDVTDAFYRIERESKWKVVE